MKQSIAAALHAAALACLAVPMAGHAMTATEIMKEVDDVNRGAFTTAIVKVQLATCRYVANNGGASCKEKPRVTVLEVGEKKWGAEKKDSRAIALVLQPITDKGVGMLTYEYPEAD